MALMLITHDLAVVAEVADRLAIMNRGRVVEAGRDRRGAARDRATPTPARSSPPPPPAGAAAACGARRRCSQVEGMVRDYPAGRRGLFGRPEAFRAVRRGELHAHAWREPRPRGRERLRQVHPRPGDPRRSSPMQGGSIADRRRGGRRRRAHAASLRAKMQAVFQDPYGSFNPRHRVGRLVAEPFHLLDGAAPRGGAARGGGPALEDVGLAGRRRRQVHPRVLRRPAPAHRHRPGADHPAEADRPRRGGLGARRAVRAQILDLLADLRAGYGLAYLFICHDLGVVRAITDRVLVMQAGEIVESRGRRRRCSTPRSIPTPASCWQPLQCWRCRHDIAPEPRRSVPDADHHVLAQDEVVARPAVVALRACAPRVSERRSRRRPSAIVVPFSPRTAAGTSARAQMIARPPVARAKSCAASTFGPIEPAGKE